MTKQLLVGGGVLLLCLGLAGCMTLQGWSVSAGTDPESPVMLIGHMSELDDEEERSRLAGSVLSEHAENPTSRSALRLAVVRSLPGHVLSDRARALELLESLDAEELSEAERRLRSWLGADLEQRLDLQASSRELRESNRELRESAARLRQSNAELRESLRSARAELASARERIEVLTQIEQTIGPDGLEEPEDAEDAEDAEEEEASE